VDARRAIYPVLASQAAKNASRRDIETLQESIARMHTCVQDSELFREEARRFMSLVATASGNRVLALMVDALHRMSEGAGAEWDEKQRRSALRNYKRVVHAIESGKSEEARSIMEKSLVAAARYWERTAPDELKEPVAWIDSDH
jgi:DNA-binding FadR family transcriptional regulator